MAAKSFQLVLGATAKRLSDVYGGPPGTVDAAKDIPFHQFFFQVEGADAFIGDQTVTTTNYGIKTAVVGQASVGGGIGPFATGPVKLSDFWAVGTGATMHILGIPF